MFATPANLAATDVRQWFLNTWVTVDGYAFPRYVADVSEGLVYHTDGRGAPYMSAPAAIVHAHWPRLGAMTFSDGFAAYVQRKPAKIYRRSFCTDVLKLAVPCAWDAAEFSGRKGHAGPWQQSSWITSRSREMAAHFWAPEYPAFLAAVEMLLQNKAVSIALSRTIIISESIRDDNGGKLAVYHNGLLMGSADRRGVFTPGAKATKAVTMAIMKRIRNDDHV